MPRKTRSSLSASEDMISLKRYPKKYAITLDKKDYNARVLARYYMDKLPSQTIVPHTRRVLTDEEFGRVLERIKGTPAAAWYSGSKRKPKTSSLSVSSSSSHWAPMASSSYWTMAG